MLVFIPAAFTLVYILVTFYVIPRFELQSLRVRLMVALAFPLILLVLVSLTVDHGAVSVLFALMALGICYFDLHASIIRPVISLARAADLRSGPGSEVLSRYSRRSDEIGSLSAYLTEHAGRLQSIADFADTLVHGSFHAHYEAVGDDETGRVLRTLQKALHGHLAEIREVLHAASKESTLDVRINLENKEGAWRDLSMDVNELLASFSAPLKEFNGIIKAMAGGDLTRRYGQSAKGVIYEMAHDLNLALDNIDGLLTQVTRHARTIDESSVEMKVSGQEMNTSTNEIATSIAQMSHGAQMQVTKVDASSRLIESILEASKAMGLKAEDINRAANSGVTSSKSGLKMVTELVNGMGELSGFSAATTQSMRVLTERSREIERVLKVITDIAGQTNLLALNAAIEAAQAGDAGRGFSVVAEEIRKLAEDSKESAKEIQRLVMDVQTDTKEASRVIELMGVSVKSAEKSSNDASAVFREILSTSNNTLQLSEEILTSARTQVSGINEVVSNIESVVVIAEQTAAATEEVASSASELSSGMNSYNDKARNLAEISESLKDGLSMVKLSGNAGENTAIFKMREAFEHEKMLLDALLDYMPDSIYFKDMESKVIRGSVSYARSHGYDDPTQILGKTDFDFNPTIAPRAYEDEQKIIASGKSSIINMEEKKVSKDGKVIYLSTTKLPLYDLNKNIIGTYGITRDITEMKVVEQQTLDSVSKQNELFGDILDYLDYKIALKDPKGTIYLINKLVAEDYGYPVNEILGKSDYDFLDKDFADKIHRIEKELVEGREPAVSLERVKTGNKYKYWFIRKIPILIPTHDDWGLLVVQKEMEQDRVEDPKYIAELREQYPNLVLDLN